MSLYEHQSIGISAQSEDMAYGNNGREMFFPPIAGFPLLSSSWKFAAMSVVVQCVQKCINQNTWFYERIFPMQLDV